MEFRRQQSLLSIVNRGDFFVLENGDRAVCCPGCAAKFVAWKAVNPSICAWCRNIYLVPGQ